jgi:hypothetical protein
MHRKISKENEKKRKKAKKKRKALHEENYYCIENSKQFFKFSSQIVAIK